MAGPGASSGDAGAAPVVGIALVVGVEIADGGTRLVATIGAAAGGRRWYTRLDAPPMPAEALGHLNALIARALAESGLAGSASPAPCRVAVGVALAGQVDPAHGVVRSLRPAEGWEGFGLAAALTERWGGPVVVRTTTQAAALAEARLGAGRGHADVLYVSIGRSIAAGLVLAGRVYNGARGRAGELAHWSVGPAGPDTADGPRCSCGARNHLEPIASAQAVVRRMIGRAADHPASSAALLAISGGRAEAATAAQVAQLAADGDPVARGVIDEALAALAPALANVIGVLDPGVVVIGGPLASARDTFLGPLADRVRVQRPTETDRPALLGADLEPAAALIGAAVGAAEARAETGTR
jgi:glucokinase